MSLELAVSASDVLPPPFACSHSHGNDSTAWVRLRGTRVRAR